MVMVKGYWQDDPRSNCDYLGAKYFSSYEDAERYARKYEIAHIYYYGQDWLPC